MNGVYAFLGVICFALGWIMGMLRTILRELRKR